jgi:isoleucyl-tRNA synthetase
VHTETYTHTYPFCWRCRTPLIYWAKLVWFIATSKFRDTLLADNAEVDWRPEHIRSGRYGDWLANNIDWAVSRERYWGTPLPLWRCADCTHVVAVGSLAELGEHAGGDLSELDPHRPHVDEITFGCPSCATGTMRRVPEVIDAWYDSGSMPFAQYGYPYQPGSAEAFENTFPADYTAEAIDQTRGWWYSLQSVSTLLFGRTSYRRALCLGHIVDSTGRKMSKSLGNVLEPMKLIGEYGADALRWLFLVDGNPWQSRRVGDEGLRNVTRKLLMTVWNVYYFLVTYANLSGWSPEQDAPALPERSTLDRYVLAELAAVVSEVDSSMADFDVTRAGRRIAAFVEDLSNWYVRTTREKFWHGEPGSPLPADTRAAFATLYTCVTTLTGLVAPFLPFLADELHETLVRPFDPAAPDSVHLGAFPAADKSAGNPHLRQAMELARRVVALGREARSAAGMPVRRPLRQAAVTAPRELTARFDEVRDVIAAELNVKELVLATAENGHLIEYEIKPNWRELGRAFGKLTQEAAAAIRGLDPAEAVRELRDTGGLTVAVAGVDARIDAAGVQVTEVHATGWQVSSDGGCSVALDLTVDDELRREGLAREFVRALNDLRKRLGYDLADRVQLDVAVLDDPGEDISVTLRTFAEMIASEVRATELRMRVDAADPVRLELGEGMVLVALRNRSVQS